jgi:hypothetical protein
MRLKNPAVMMRIGMTCLLMFGLWPRFLPWTANLSADLVDGIRGVLLGAAIALNLWSVWLTSHSKRDGDGRAAGSCD